jgi:hypothetical protein
VWSTQSHYHGALLTGRGLFPRLRLCHTPLRAQNIAASIRREVMGSAVAVAVILRVGWGGTNLWTVAHDLSVAVIH